MSGRNSRKRTTVSRRQAIAGEEQNQDENQDMEEEDDKDILE